MTKRISANRRNAKKSTGPNNTTSTRFNATKHGLLAAGITELDDADEYQNTLSRLNQAYLAELETFLLKRIALSMTRLGRSARLEVEYITDILNPPIYGEAHESVGMALFERPLIDWGLPARVSSEKFEPLVKIFQRYDTALENKLFRAMHEVERLQRAARAGLLQVVRDWASNFQRLLRLMSPFTPILANWIRLLNVRTKPWRVLFLSPPTKEKTLIQKPHPRKAKRQRLLI